MAIKIFEKLGKWLQGDSVEENNDSLYVENDQTETIALKETQRQEGIQPQEIAQGFNNSIQKSATLINAVTDTLCANYRGTHTDFSQRILVLWIEETLFFDVLNDADIVSDLRQKLCDELDFDFKEILLRNETIPSQNTTQIMPHVGMSVVSNNISVVRSATLSIVEGCGSLVSSPVLLDANEIQNLPGKRYNIGISEEVKLANGHRRVNHIAIDDDPSSPQFDNNKYVSRTHAYITYHDDYGFVLHVEAGGTRASGKRTHVTSGDKRTEYNNPLIPVPLKDGDIIELSKKVMLSFNVKK